MTAGPWFHRRMLDLAARRPTVSNPALKRGRAIALQRVTMRPQAAPEAPPKAAWRVPSMVAPAAAAALIAAVPLAHAAAPDPYVDTATPIEIALAPEPIETAQPIGGSSVADIAVFHKLEGIKANPYESMGRGRPVVRAQGPQGTRPRIIRKAPRVAPHEPQKMSDLKANPYD